MKVYQIRDWDTHFENNKSRERDRLSFVCIPNKQHGLGFCRIMAEKDGASIYGIWHLITGACSQQSRPREGWLTDTGRAPDGHPAGTAWAPEDLALKFRRPVDEIQRALDVLCSKYVGWMICHNGDLQVPVKCPSSARRVPDECPGREGKEGKGKKGREVSPSVEVILHEKELERVEARIKKVLAQATEVANGKTFTPEQRSELARLRQRKKELLDALGMQV